MFSKKYKSGFSRTRVDNFPLNYNADCTGSEDYDGYGETAEVCSFASAFAGRLCFNPLPYRDAF